MTRQTKGIKVHSDDLFFWENSLGSQGIRCLAGIDEAGRGPLAGPVVAAAVCLPCEWWREELPAELSGIQDSKKLSPKKRCQLFELITNHSEIRYGIGMIESREIDRINILNATYKAMDIAASSIIDPIPDHALVDGLPVKGLSVPHTAIVKGDSKSYSIAAASIVAKEYRDRLMQNWDTTYPEYGFAKHKGYGTATHRQAILSYGPCPLHRESFLRNLMQQQALFSWED
ncbi:ribonuclease HII [bacterium]|nr:ribonuclease HII [bacterium]